MNTVRHGGEDRSRLVAQEWITGKAQLVHEAGGRGRARKSGSHRAVRFSTCKAVRAALRTVSWSTYLPNSLAAFFDRPARPARGRSWRRSCCVARSFRAS